MAWPKTSHLNSYQQYFGSLTLLSATLDICWLHIKNMRGEGASYCSLETYPSQLLMAFLNANAIQYAETQTADCRNAFKRRLAVEYCLIFKFEMRNKNVQISKKLSNPMILKFKLRNKNVLLANFQEVVKSNDSS